MSGFLQSPTFSPPVGPITLGTPGQVLTMVGAVPKFATGGGGGGGQPVLGAASPYASPSGVVPTAAPPGFTSTTGRVNVTLSGNTTWDAMTAGSDGQLIAVSIVSGNFTLTLPAGAGFRAPAGGTILSLQTTKLMYYDTTAGLWVIC
jgi:hypothetical protein